MEIACLQVFSWSKAILQFQGKASLSKWQVYGAAHFGRPEKSTGKLDLHLSSLPLSSYVALFIVCKSYCKTDSYQIFHPMLVFTIMTNL